MADKSTLGAMKKKLVDDILKLMLEANNVYFVADDHNDCIFASRTFDFCKNLLNSINF